MSKAGMTLGEQNGGLGDILKMSSQLMANRGYHGTSMRDLANETGRSLSGLYHYFSSKEDLLFQINLSGFTTLNDRAKEILTEIDDPYEALFGLICVHVCYFVNHMDEMKVMIWGTKSLEKLNGRRVSKLKKSYFEIGREVVENVHVVQGIKNLDDKALSRKTYHLFGMLNWIFSWYQDSQSDDSQELAEEIYALYMNGVQKEKDGTLNKKTKNKIWKHCVSL